MKLIPYHHTFAEMIMDWQMNPKNRRFFRGMDRYLTLDEIEQLPKSFGEVFMVEEAREIIGLTYCKCTCPGVYEFGVLVRADKQKKNRGTWIAKLIEDYIFNMKNARKINLYVSREHGLCRVCEEDLGYTLVGSLKQHTYVDGKYEDLFIYEKVR